MRIGELPRQIYEGNELVFSYDTSAYYEVRLRDSGTVMSAEFIRVNCPRRHVEFTDRLFAPHWADPHAYGVWDGNELLAVMEVTPEWNGRLRITNLCVRDGFRRRGLGTMLITRARELARAQGMRGLILETQSCNAGAIAFYLSQGLTLQGFDASCYQNDDIARHEVRMEFGCRV